MQAPVQQQPATVITAPAETQGNVVVPGDGASNVQKLQKFTSPTIDANAFVITD
jgi:hypothetical protein